MNTALINSNAHRRTAALRRNSQKNQAPAAVLRRVIGVCGFVAALVSVAVLADALSMRNVIWSAIVLAAIATIELIRPHRRRAAVTAQVGSQALMSAIVRGVGGGLAFAALMALILPLAALLPTPASWSDRDRPAIESQIDTLSRAGNYETASELISKRLPQPISAAWRNELQERRVELLVSAGQTATSRELQIKHWQAAVAAAREYGLDERLPQALLDSLNFKTIQEQALREVSQASANQLRMLLAHAVEIASPDARDAMLRAIVKFIPKEHWPKSLPQSLVDNLLRWADKTSNLAQKQQHLSAAVAECQRWGIDAKLAQLRLELVEQEITRRAPVLLPAGTKARVLAIHSAADAAVAFDVVVESATGTPITYLAAKDFIVTSAGQPVASQQVTRASFSTAENLSVVVLLDYSPSTQAVRSAATTGTIALASSAPARAQFRVLAFHEQVVAVTDWTHRFTEIDTRLRSFHTAGTRTSLRQAIKVGLAELAARPGARVLVLFTDGRDTVAQAVSDAELIAECRAKNVRVMAIGLESPDLDAPFLTRLAEGASGRYWSAARQDELVERFRSLELQQTSAVHRVALLATQQTSGPLTLTIGRGEHAVRIDLPRPTQAATPVTSGTRS